MADGVPMKDVQTLEKPPAANVYSIGVAAVRLSMLKHVRNQMHSLISMAVEVGVSTQDFVSSVGDEIRPFIADGIRSSYATPEEGLAELLMADGGCVGVTEARKLFRKPEPISRQALTSQIRRGNVIGYLSGGNHYLIPTWQFRPEGGVWEGLPELLRMIREKIPGSDQLTPFTFFLQNDPVTGGETPLSALRAGDLKSVRNAIEARIA
jgi:hypothetical protein